MGLSNILQAAMAGTPAPMPPPAGPSRSAPVKEVPSETQKGPPKAPA